MRVVVVVLAATLAGVGLLELGTRALALTSCQHEVPGLFRRSPFFGWGHVPGGAAWVQRCLHGAPEWRTWVQINSRGLRDREIPYERGAAARILVLGDSFTEGRQVAMERHVVKLVERELNAPDAPGTRVEVLNAGHSAWGTDNALLFFEHEGWRYRPDVVVLMFNTGNDVFENHRPFALSTAAYPEKPYFRLVDGRLVREQHPLPDPPLLQRAAAATYRTLSHHSAFVRRVGTVPAVWRYLQAPALPPPGTPETPTGEVYLREYPPAWREAWRVTRGLVLRLRQMVEARGARFVVVVLNMREEVSPKRMEILRVIQPGIATADLDPDKPDRLIRRFLARRGIPTIPLLDAFRARFAGDGTPGFFAWDVHWAEPGHALAAERIADGLRSLGVVDGRYGSVTNDAAAARPGGSASPPSDHTANRARTVVPPGASRTTALRSSSWLSACATAGSSTQ